MDVRGIKIEVLICVVLIHFNLAAKVPQIQGNRVNAGKPGNVSITSASLQVATLPTTTITTTRRPILSGLRFPCSCQEGECGCCTGYILDRFNQKGCINITYDPDDFSMTAYMSMNGKVLYKNSISGKNPPPLCIGVPRFQNIRFCVEFSNIFFASRNVHLCIDAEANWQDFTLLQWSFDCIRMGAAGFAVLPPEEGGGLPVNSNNIEEEEEEDYDDSAKNAPVEIQSNSLIFHKSIKNLNKRKLNRDNVKLKKLGNNSVLISYDRKY